MTAPPPTWLVRCGLSPSASSEGAGLTRIGTDVPSRGRAFAAYSSERPAPTEGFEIEVTDDLVVVLAGWLSNRPELGPRRGPDAPPGRTQAGLILDEYRKVGEESLRALTGRFAAIVWERIGDRIVATHDQVGTYPLFWAQFGTTILFSNAIDTLLDHPSVSRDLNRAALADHLRSQHPDRGETFFAAVRRVPPGHTLVDSAGSRRCRKTWDPVPQGNSGWATPEEIEGFGRELAAAVGRNLVRGPVGIWLSGGLDSVSVASCASDLTPAEEPSPLALSIRFPDPSTDEEHVQRAVAEQLSLPMVMFDLADAVAPFGVLEASTELAGTWPVPTCHPWLAPYMNLGLAGVERGCMAILTGHGGDEWLEVSPYLAADRLARLDFPGVVRLARTAMRSHQLSLPLAIRSFGWRFGLRPLLGRRVIPRLAPGLVAARDCRQLARDTPPWLAPDPELRREIDARYVPPPNRGAFYEHELRRSLDHTLVAMDLEELYEAGNRIGAPILLPLLDARLIELLSRVPPDVLNADGRTKALVRSRLGHRFPDLGFDRQKKMTALDTLSRILGDEAPNLWTRMGGAGALAALGVVDEGLLAESAAKVLPSGDAGKQWRLFQVPPVEIFARTRAVL